MEPFNSPLRRNLGSSLHHFGADSPALKSAMHRSVQNEPVNPAIPGHIDESHETRAVERPDIRQTPQQHRSESAFGMVLPSGGEEIVEGSVRQLWLSFIFNLIHESCHLTCRFSRAVLGVGWKRLSAICQVALSLGPKRSVAEPVVVLTRAQQHVFDP